MMGTVAGCVPSWSLWQNSWQNNLREEGFKMVSIQHWDGEAWESIFIVAAGACNSAVHSSPADARCAPKVLGKEPWSWASGTVVDQLTQAALSWKEQKENPNAGGPGIPLHLKLLTALHLLHSHRFKAHVLLHSGWLERKTPGLSDILLMPVIHG